jgi:hypothetical protein
MKGGLFPQLKAVGYQGKFGTTAPSYVADRFKTHPGMLPQFQALKGKTADKPGIGTKRVLLKRRSATFPRGDAPQGARHKTRKGRV